jgi:hypothetical protein
MVRYYFYQADFFVADTSNPLNNREGGTHGIWVVEDDSSPDVILAAIEKWLYEQREEPAQNAPAQNAPQAAGQATAATVSFVIRQFNNIS